MLPYIENILQTLTGKSSLNDVSEDELKLIADKYPYFGATQFLHAKKLYPAKTKNAEEAIQKAALYFTDALWLHYNFFEEEEIAEEQETALIGKAPDSNAEYKEEATVNSKALSVQEILAEAEIILNEEGNLKEQAYVNDADEKEIDTIEEESKPQEIEGNDFENLAGTATSEIEDAELLDEPETGTELETETNEKLSNLLKEQAASFEKPVEETALPIETTAFHRIDYFESQGIKLEEEKANDKLGTQLKKFTEWLKQMKRINPNLTNLESDAAAESQVQNMAEYSNEPKEIVTEAMAEVLIKQGKPEQAIQIYEKLSFFNPSKSAYFAAKIQELKA